MKYLAMSGLAMLAIAAPAQAKMQHPVHHTYLTLYKKVAKLHGSDAPGRQIHKYGLREKLHGKWVVHKARYKDYKESIAVLRRKLMPTSAAQYVVSGPPPVPPADTQTLHAGGILSKIAACESTNNPRAVSPGGTYRGKYQFDMQTWASVGGSGDPAAASEEEQDRRAAILLAQRGTAPWPICGN